ncbi:hypothetical protein JW948_11080 [bacterium]|nr:hypothetical protein [bacterium]
MINRTIISGLFCLSISLLQAESGRFEGYTDIVRFRDLFYAVGTDGRIDRISEYGESEPVDRSGRSGLNCAFADDKLLIVAGDQGTIGYSEDGMHFEYTEPATERNIHCITAQNGALLAGADAGTVLLSTDGRSWHMIRIHAEGNIISLSATSSFFIGITDAGEIIRSPDGIHWEITDYNKAYAGFNKFSRFKKILAAGKRIVIIGTFDDGSPSILFSSLGNIWGERIPVYHDEQGMADCLTDAPNDITYDSGSDQFILVCDDGVLFSISNCTKCSKRLKIGEKDLYAVLSTDNCLLITGDEYAVFVQRL